MKLPRPLELFPSVFSAILGSGFLDIFHGRMRGKQNLKRVLSATLVVILLSGTLAAVYLVQNNQDLRQQAAFFNLGGGLSRGGTVETFVVNGQPVENITVDVTEEAFRDTPSLIFANGYGSNSSSTSEVRLLLKQGEAIVLNELYPALSVKEHPLAAGNYTLSVNDAESGRQLYQTGILLENNSLVVITRTPGEENGTFRYFDVPFSQAAPVRVYNLSNASQTVSGGNLAYEFQPTTIQSNHVADPAWNSIDSTEFTVFSPFEKLNKTTVKVQNSAHHRLFFFILGDEKSSRISLATIPLPINQTQDEMAVKPDIQTGDQTLDSLLKNRAPLKDIFQHLEHSYFDTADQTYLLAPAEAQTSGFAKIKKIGNQTLAWSKIPSQNQTPDLQNTIYSLFAVTTKKNEVWDSSILRSSVLLGWFVPSGDGSGSLISVKLLDSMPTATQDTDLLLGVLRYTGGNKAQVAAFGLPATVENNGDTYTLRRLR